METLIHVLTTNDIYSEYKKKTAISPSKICLDSLCKPHQNLCWLCVGNDQMGFGDSGKGNRLIQKTTVKSKTSHELLELYELK